MSSTRQPVAASAVARLIAVVVLPTPPFWLATAIRINVFPSAFGEPRLATTICASASVRLGSRRKSPCHEDRAASSSDLAFRPLGRIQTVPGVEKRSASASSFGKRREGAGADHVEGACRDRFEPGRRGSPPVPQCRAPMLRCEGTPPGAGGIRPERPRPGGTAEPADRESRRRCPRSSQVGASCGSESDELGRIEDMPLPQPVERGLGNQILPFVLRAAADRRRPPAARLFHVEHRACAWPPPRPSGGFAPRMDQDRGRAPRE